MTSSVNRVIFWLSAIIVPFVLFSYFLKIGFSMDKAIFIGIASVTLLSWMFTLTYDFVPALLALLLLMLFGLVPNSVALSGFSSNGFLIAFSVMGLGAVITSSGLAQRYTLWLLKTIPANTFAHQVAVFFTGFMLNPIVPTITARAVITAPVLNNIVDSWDETSKKKSSTLLYLSGLDGINFLSPVFLTAAPANLMVFGLFAAQDQQAFSFMFWFYAASITGSIMLVSYFVLSAVFFRGYEKVKINKKNIEKEWRALEKMNRQEWAALTGIAMMTVGIITNSIHKIPIPLITFTVICSLLIMGVLNRDDFIKKIDWSFLFLLASIIGIMASMNHLGIDKMIIAKFGGLKEFIRMDFHKFVLVLCGVTIFVRIFIPLNSAILILAAGVLPLASGAGISPWVVGFIILIISETAFFGYQSPYILFFRGLTRDSVSYSEKKVQLFHGLLLLVKIAAIYASIPFWREIGIL